MRNLRLFLRYARLNLMSAAEYRASFLGAALGMLLNNSTFVYFWWVAFGYAGESIGGYSFDDVMFIWAASSTAYGLAHVFFDGVRGLSRTIVQGELDIFLLQPKPPLLSLACSKTDFTSWGDLLYGFVLMALTGQNSAAWLWFLLGALGGALLIPAGLLMGAHPVGVHLKGLLILAALVAVSAVGFSFYNQLLRYHPVGQIAIYNAFIPVLGVVLSCLLLGEPFSWRYLLSGALVTIGICAVNLPAKARIDS